MNYLNCEIRKTPSGIRLIPGTDDGARVSTGMGTKMNIGRALSRLERILPISMAIVASILLLRGCSLLKKYGENV